MSSIKTISTTITRRLGSSSTLDSFVRGVISEYFPSTQNEYNNYRRFLHDILCVGLISNGYYAREHLTLNMLSISHPDPSMNMMSPDLFTIHDDVIKVGEVSMTYDIDQTKIEKMSKYIDFFHFIESKTNKRVMYTVHLVDLSTPEWRQTLPDCPKTHEDLLSRMIDNLRLIHATPKGFQFWKMQMKGEEFQFDFKPNMDIVYGQLCDTLGVARSTENKSLICKLANGHQEQLSEAENYFESLADAVLNKRQPRPYPEFGYGDPSPFYEEFDKLFVSPAPTTVKVPVVLQLGAPSIFVSKSYANRRLLHNDLKDSSFLSGYGFMVKLWCKENSVDATWDGRMELKLSDAQLQIEMSQGPGRKKYLRMMNVKQKRDAPRHIGVKPRHTLEVMDFLSNMQNLGMDEESDAFELDVGYEFLPTDQQTKKIIRQYEDKLSDDGTSNVLQFYTRCSREIIINSMRRRSRREYVLCQTGYDGIFILISPGPQLRTESNVIFVKIISKYPGFMSDLSRKWLQLDENQFETEWLSVDTDRLKHWACASERVLLSNLGSAEKLVTKDMNYHTAINAEMNSRNFALMAAIYLENKQLTSTTIQTSRYVMMKALGDRQYSGILAKFPERVGSILQSHILQRMLQYVKECSTFKVLERATNRQVVRDDMTGLIDESTAGITGLLPRLFTFGGPVPIQYNINEIYWCMMYNKDRQNKTQDAMKILKKIVKEEVKMDEELKSRDSDEHKINHFFGTHTTDDDVNHIITSNPESHYYSKRFVSLCATLQSVDKSNHGSGGTWLTKSKINSILNKNLSEYSTFKASVNHIKKFISTDDLDAVNELGQRTKCIELVHELVSSEGLVTVKDVVMQNMNADFLSTFQILIQIFKKNQVGGVREILILYIKARILINVTEELCRLLAKADERETLTKGRDKRLMMRSDFDELSSELPAGTPMIYVKNSYDMATWCQKFIPTIFLSIFNINKEELEDCHTLCVMVLLKHCMKQIEFPKALVEQWVRHPDINHTEPGMQELKDEFRKSGKTHIVNKCNMGQGILHYGSTVIGINCQSGRDKLFDVCLSKLGQKQCISWKTRLGSDDKGDVIALDLRDPNCHFQARLLDQCSRASERLCSIELSVKSASGCLIYEFNSAFMANLEVQSPVIKFTLASCDMINTDSCTRFVNESFSRIRQLKENGGSSLLCTFAHLMNRRFFYDIFQTGVGMVNDVERILTRSRETIPYDFGVYPYFDADLNELLGPEYHNYRIFKDNPSDPIMSILFRDITQTDSVDNYVPTDDEGLFKKDVFGITQGLIKQLENMKDRLSVTSEQVMEYLRLNPFMIIRGPMNAKETEMLIASKLCTRGASESLRRTSPAIYLGRMSAFASAEGWRVNDEETRYTYSEYLSILKSRSKHINYESYRSLIFPNHKTYDVAEPYVGSYGPMQRSKRNYAQAVRVWTLNSYNYNFTASLRSILETAMGLSSEAPIEDVKELRRSIPFEMRSYDEFIEECSAKEIRPIDVFFYLTKFYKLSNEKKAQIFAYGPSTNSWINTMSASKTFNHIHGSTMVMDSILPEENVDEYSAYFQNFEILKLGFNMRLMESQSLFDKQNVLSGCQFKGVKFDDYLTTLVRNVKSLRSLDNQTKKICMYMASQLLTKKEFREKLISWRQINFSYLKRQVKDSYGQWRGDLIVLVSFCSEVYTVECTQSGNVIHAKRIESLTDFQESLRMITRTLGLDITTFCVHGRSRPMDIIYKHNSLVFSQRSHRSANVLNVREYERFRFKSLEDFSTFNVISKINDDESVSIKLEDVDGAHLTICHFPGHYYPTSIPLQLKIVGDHMLCGIPLKTLLMNKSWFIDGRMPQLTEAETISLIRNINFSSLFSKITKSTVQIGEYIEDFRINELTRMAEDYDFSASWADQVNDEEELTEIELQTILNQAALDVIADDRFYHNAVGEESFDPTDLIEGFTSALGENTTIARRKEFFTISNLRTTANFKFKVLNLFFDTCDIAMEKKDSLPDMLLYLHRTSQMNNQDEVIRELHNYVTEKVSVNFGKSKSDILKLMDRLSSTTRKGRSIRKVEQYLIGEDQTIADMIDDM
nr:RNA-dependent RNA polymerase [Erysiphe necator associated negative-stranded RNA virus 3]